MQILSKSNIIGKIYLKPIHNCKFLTLDEMEPLLSVKRNKQLLNNFEG